MVRCFAASLGTRFSSSHLRIVHLRRDVYIQLSPSPLQCKLLGWELFQQRGKLSADNSRGQRGYRFDVSPPQLADPQPAAKTMTGMQM